MSTSLDKIFADEPSVQALPDGPEGDPRASSDAEPAAETSEGETPEPVSTKASTKSEAATADDDGESDGPDPKELNAEGLRKALKASRGDTKAERTKRRELELRLARLEGQHSKPEEKPKEAEKVDYYADPEAAVEARVKAVLKQVEDSQFIRDANRSERSMRRQHEDYEDAKAAFEKAAQAASPALRAAMWAQVREDPDPAEVVYAEGKKLLGGGDELSKLRARLAELEGTSTEADPEDIEPKRKASVKPIPRTIAASRGTGASIKPAFKGPTPLEKVYD